MKKAALEAGKHGRGSLLFVSGLWPLASDSSPGLIILAVIIEKPFTVTTAEADSLIALAREKQRILTVYQNRRYDSDFRTLRHLMELDPSPFGKVTEFANHYDMDDPPWVKGWVAEEAEPGMSLPLPLVFLPLLVQPRSCL